MFINRGYKGGEPKTVLVNKPKMKHKLRFAVILGIVALLATIVAAEEHENISEDLEVPEEAEQLPEEADEQADIRVPGDRFYFATSVSERIEMGMARAPGIGGPDREAQVETNHAERRLAEAEALSQRNDTERAEQAVERYSQGIERASERANQSGNEEVQQRIAEASQQQTERLESLRERLPQEAQQGINRAIENSQRAGPPSDVGPGADTGPSEDVGPNQTDPSETGSEQADAPEQEQAEETEEQAESGDLNGNGSNGQNN